ncbi:MAG: 2-C-methyl-D-erythritol 4-phosphate cytidylyltransferase [Methylotenera sp.]|uniref:2-C-methyl-D-erythritol 4-phosphate cytidylyltransferase n=1 Tax=Methylotenera sp. TaxID=2051956 RepID=UPI000D4B1AA0|nr:2-C-methyl-D-erythritol 4-phosphate cytidylyltransferase [Methylotenera sp.]MDP3210517.1 2-C-methyl-D-erythritol 4-phosphate cytidylyltransferase [Methylotenera sp.]PPC90759.1 MAG: 2-C-methyl-D-erythritol 4-phosphate cytidylyltransferase [Methylotenera sp.]
MARFHIVIPAAGIGNRMETAIPKQYLPISGKPMISYSIQTFFASLRIASIHLALSPEDYFWRNLDLAANSRLQLHYTGGETRAQTVLNTLYAMKSQVDVDDWILVHDAARPGLTLALLDTLLNSLENDAVGGLLALPLADTLKQSNADDRVKTTIPRDGLWQAQTPQMFRYRLLTNALESFDGVPTDEAQAIEALGFEPKLVTGSLRNMKVTYPQDMALMELFIQKEIV